MLRSHRRLFRSLFIALLAIFAACGSTLTVYAQLDYDTLKIYADNNIIYYDPTASLCRPSVNTKPTGQQITWIGDSYTFLGEQTYKIISTKLPGTDIHGKSGRRFGEHVDNFGGVNSGIEEIEDMLNNNETIRNYVVFALGTNDSTLISGGVNYIDKLEELLGSNRTIILVTPRVREPNSSYTTNVIPQMQAAAATYSNIIIADWATAVEQAGVDEHFAAENNGSGGTIYIHPNEKGYQLWVDTIYNALPGGVSALAGNNNEEKIWNFFVSAQIDGVSNNAAAIAGIMGNLSVESNNYTCNSCTEDSKSYDPFLVSGNYRGLFMFSDSYGALDMKAEVDASVGQDYWHQLGTPSTATDEAVAIAINIELSYLVNKYPEDRFHKVFLANMNNIEQTPKSYAELFLVSIERAWPHGSDSLKDLGLLPIVQAEGKTMNNWQGADVRKSNANDIYAKYANDLSSSKLTSTTSTTGSGITWDSDGWITGGFDNFDQSPGASDPYLGETPQPRGEKPTKILLHNTEGTASGIEAYPMWKTDANGNYVYQADGQKIPYRFPAHFTVDLLNQRVSQHFSIWDPSLASAGGVDTAGVIQIEIVGFNTPANASSKYYLGNFTSREWGFLAVLLSAIAEQTGIPLEEAVPGLDWSVDWPAGTVHRLDEATFNSATGILGHMHAPGNDHVDPGNIWPQLQAALSSVSSSSSPVASKYSTGNSITSCLAGDSGQGLVSGGMTFAQAEQFMAIYRQIAIDYSDANGYAKWRGQHQYLSLDGKQVQVYHAGNGADGCSQSGFANCTSFSQYFVNRYTDYGPSLGSSSGGQFVQTVLGPAGFQTGTTPKVYAVFSKSGGEWGHTGVILGIEGDKIITGEASCYKNFATNAIDDIGAKYRDLSYFNGVKFAYTDGHLLGF